MNFLEYEVGERIRVTDVYGNTYTGVIWGVWEPDEICDDYVIDLNTGGSILGTEMKKTVKIERLPEEDA